MRSSYLPYGHQWIDEADIKAVAEALRADRITTGDKVREFEKKVASYCGAKYAVAVSSGTSALHCACAVVGISKGDEVITTPITFFATIASVMMCGGSPILTDVREDTINIDPCEILNKITPKTKAIIPVDFAGHPADLDEIAHIAECHNLVVVEDACHALGAEYKSRKVGGLSDMTVFSFHPVKAITSAEGGMVLTNSKNYYDRLCMFRNHNIRHGLRHWQYEICDIGWNYRLTDLACALGISQLAKLDRFVARRREIAYIYNEAFDGIKEIVTPTEMGYAKSAYHLYVIQLEGIDRERFIESLVGENIGAQVHYIPAHYQPCLSKFGYKKGDFPNAEAYYDCAVSLPLFPKMEGKDINDVINAVRKAVLIGRQ